MRRIILSFALPLAGISAAFELCGCHTHAKVSDRERPAAASASSAPHADRIEISEKGFAPSHVIVENAQPLVFRRTTDKGCATAVVFPQFRIEEPLPLDTDVSIVLPPTASGEVAFQCGVGENRGKVVASVVGS
jgi:plastocyanin domain-containing protein